MVSKEVYDEIKKIVDSSGVKLQNTHGAPVLETRPTLDTRPTLETRPTLDTRPMLDTFISMSRVQVGDMIAKGKVINTISGGPLYEPCRDQYIWRMHDMTSSRVVEEVELFGCDNAEGAIEDIVYRRRKFGMHIPLSAPEFIIVGPQEFVVVLEPRMYSNDGRVIHFRFVRKDFGNKYYFCTK